MHSKIDIRQKIVCAYTIFSKNQRIRRNAVIYTYEEPENGLLRKNVIIELEK